MGIWTLPDAATQPRSAVFADVAPTSEPVLAHKTAHSLRTHAAHDGRVTTQTVGGASAITPVKLLTVNEVAGVLGCGRTMVYELIDKGHLTRVKIGRLTRIPPSEVERFVRRGMGLEPAGPKVQPRASRHAEAPSLLLPFSDVPAG
jgi:excisionase family DNA binding protein